MIIIIWIFSSPFTRGQAGRHRPLALVAIVGDTVDNGSRMVTAPQHELQCYLCDLNGIPDVVIWSLCVLCDTAITSSGSVLGKLVDASINMSAMYDICRIIWITMSASGSSMESGDNKHIPPPDINTLWSLISVPTSCIISWTHSKSRTWSGSRLS